MVRTVRSWDLTWTEFRDCVPDSIVLLPVGSFEQHGLHLPLDTDTLIAQAIAERVAERIAGIVLPPISYGARSLARSGGGDSFAATTNLAGSTLVSLIRDIVSEQIRHGVRRMAIVLGHGENDPFVIEGVSEVVRDVSGTDVRIVVIGWWHVLTDDDVQGLFPKGFPGWDLEHAGRIETALMLALAPERVRHDQIGAIEPVTPFPWTVVPSRGDDVPSQGSLSDPRGAAVEQGTRLVNLIVLRLEAVVARELPKST